MEASFPETKFSTRMSDDVTSLRTISSPSSVLKLTVIERLLRLIDRKYADSGGKWDDALGASLDRGAEGGFHEP